MEHLESQSQLNPNSTESKVSRRSVTAEEQTSVRLCQARLTEVCHKGDGQIEPERAKLRNTRYCRACAYRLKLDRNAAYKRRRRNEIGWKEFLFQYSYSHDRKKAELERKEHHRLDMRARRAYVKHRAEANLSLTEAEERMYRREFVKAMHRTLEKQAKTPANRAQPNQDMAQSVNAHSSLKAGASAAQAGQSMNGGTLK